MKKGPIPPTTAEQPARKVYDAEFLLQFRNICRQRPNTMPNIPGVVIPDLTTTQEPPVFKTKL